MVAFFVRSGFVAGPFDSPPLPNFRCNSLLAVEQDTKVRPCLNVSLPEDASLNDNVDEYLVEKVHMTNARSFSYAVLECGKDAVMSKFDQCDAYKMVPARKDDLRLQGFQWLGKYFVELSQIFGAETAVCNYDTLGHTLHIVSLCFCNIQKHLVFRQLDDLPFVAPAWTTWCEEFTETYSKICASVNVSLAPECPKFDKAFKNSCHGKVLGIWFDTKDQTWSYPEQKRDKLLIKIFDVFHADHADKEDLESLVGRLNDFSLMCPFARSFKKNIIALLTEVLTFPHSTIPVSQAAKQDLKFWWALISDEIRSLPICPRPSQPPICHKTFTSDAAGMPEDSLYKMRVGVGVLGLDECGSITCAYQWLWDRETILSCKDDKGIRLGDKSTTLEMLGVLLPLVICPELLSNQELVFQVDNTAVYWGWEKRYLTGDNMASILLRCIQLISAKLGSMIHIKHLPRVSNWEASTVDRLSRESTTTRADRQLLSSFSYKLPDPLLVWLANPSEDWSLPVKLCDTITN